MKYLYDSDGNHIANEIDGQLHSTTGENIGHFHALSGHYVNMKGYYLGEIILDHRLICKIDNENGSTSYGEYGDYGNVGDSSNQVPIDSIGLLGGYKDIDKVKLKYKQR